MSLDLRGLSDHELLSRLGRLVRDERRRLVEILRHLHEVERRGVYLRRGYGSLFDYCTQCLKYSESAACRRITAARCLKRFPEIGELLERGELNLQTVSMIAKILSEENRRALLASVCGKSKREVEAVVSVHVPGPRVRDRVRVVATRVPVTASSVLTSSNARERLEASDAGDPEKSPSLPAGTGKFSTAAGGGKKSGSDDDSRTPHMQLTRQNRFEFAAGDAFMQKFEKMRALLGSHTHAQPSFEDVFLAGMDAWLDKHDPERRHARRVARREAHKKKDECLPARKQEHRRGRRPGREPMGAHRSEDKPTKPRSRHIPAAVRDAVVAKHGGRCSYVGPSGRRCGATHNLQIDHVTPFARLGTHAAANLRLLCAKHNRMEAKRLLGRDVVAPYSRE